MKAGQASATARVIAASTVLLASRPGDEDLVPAGAAELSREFLATSWTDRCLSRSVRSPWTRWIWRGLERLTHPGIMRHYLLRKRWIEEQCLAAILEGVRRVIVIGAGLDTLAMRLAPGHPEVAWVEIDHPATQAHKRRGLAQARRGLPANLTLLGIDLAHEPLPPGLKADPRSTLVIIEGVLMYLPEPEVEALLRDQVRGLSSASVRLIFSHMVRWPEGPAGFRPNSWWIDRWLAWRGEPFRWTLPTRAVEPWLRSLGFKLLRQAEPPFSTEAGVSKGGLKGENLVMCQVDCPRQS